MTNASAPRRRWNPGPLTNRMVRVLRAASEHKRGLVSLKGVSANGKKAFVESLLRRGLIEPVADGPSFDLFITDKGRGAVAMVTQ